MDKTILLGLKGHDEQFRLDQAAYDTLARYLSRSESRLRNDPDRAEVLGDLEASIGDKLTARLGSDDRVLTVADIEAVIDEIGAVDPGTDQPAAPDESAAPPPRRLRRIREGQWFAGVCTGLAAYSEIDVAWVRTIFIFAALVTGGLFLVVYIAMAFILPVARPEE